MSEARSASGVTGGSRLFHMGSTNPDGYRRRPARYGLSVDRFDTSEVSGCYNRSVAEYEAELAGHFNLEDWIGKSLLDLGSGAYDRFGRLARQRGVHVVSVNPALKDPTHRRYLQETREYDHNRAVQEANINRPRWKFWRPRVPRPGVFSVAAVAQALPFAKRSFDGVVSVYGVPHYLHDVDPTIEDPAAMIAAYTPEVRARDKATIGLALSEVLRVLRPGATAILKDEHRSPGQTQQINSYSPSDGTEVLEVLADLRDQGAAIQVHETQQPLVTGGPFSHAIPDSIGKTERIIVMQRGV